MNPTPWGPREARAAALSLRGTAGETVAVFERETAAFLGVRGAVAMSSGVMATGLALRALGAEGKEVVLPAFAHGGLLQACRLAGAAAVPADILWHDLNISAAQARRRMTHRTAAVVAVHSFGAPAEMEALLKIGVPVVEDVSQALGAMDYDRRRLGAIGRCGVFSLGDGMMISSGGAGGMVVSNDRRLLDAVRDLCGGEGKPADRWRLGEPMTDLQAAVGREQLKRLPLFLAARERCARRYREALQGSPWEPPLPLFGRVYHRFIVKSSRPVLESVFSFLEKRGTPLYRPMARPLAWDVPGGGRYPVTDRAWRRAVALPIAPSMSDGEIEKVVKGLSAAGDPSRRPL